MPSEKFEHGMTLRRGVLSDAYGDAALANVDDFKRDFQEYVTEVAWGVNVGAWRRPGTAWRRRTLDTVRRADRPLRADRIGAPRIDGG